MSGTDLVLWSVALGLGAVVIGLTAWLLQRFAAQVRRIERGVHAVWGSGTRVAGNTATTWMLEETVARLDAVIAATSPSSDGEGA